MVNPGEGPETTLPPPLFLNKTEARMAWKKTYKTGASPYLRVWMTTHPPPPLSEGLDLPLYIYTPE